MLKTSQAVDHVVDRRGLRHRRIAASAGAGILLKLITVGTGFISVPLALRYLGNEQFGIWMAFMGLLSFLQFTDLGLGVGLQNRLTACEGANDHLRPKRLISGTLVVMLSIAGLLFLAALFVTPVIPLGLIVRTTTTAARLQLLPAARMFVIAFAILLPFGLVQYICNAYQRGYLTSGSLAAANLIGLVGTLIGIHTKLPLWWFIFVATVAPAPAYFAVGVAIVRRKAWLRPSISAVSVRELRDVVVLGIPAFGAQVGATIMLQGPTLVIASALGAAAVGPFMLSQQLLSVVNLLLNVAIMPLWPAYGEAAARGDLAWIKRTFARSIWASFAIVGITSVLVALFGRSVIQIWTGRPEIVPSFSLLMACTIWAVVMAWNRVTAVLLNGLGRMFGQAVYGTLIPAFAMVIAYVFGAKFGAAGVIWFVVAVGESLRATCLAIDVFLSMKLLESTQR